MSDGPVYIGDELESDNEKPELIKAHLGGEVLEVASNPEESVLETLLGAGFNPPYSCMDGNCMACMAKIKSGRAYQEEPGILTEDNIDEREILTCQARPLSKILEIDYDEVD